MKQTEISVRGLIRLLPATYHKPPSLRDLVDTDDEMEIVAEIEGLTSGRLQAERGRNPHLDPRELAGNGATAICASMGTVTSTPPSPTPAPAETASTPRSEVPGTAHGM